MSRPPKTLNRERLLEVVTYDPETGVFRWKTNGRGRRADDIAGGINKALGYWVIGIDGQQYYAHRIAWLYMTGEWPLRIDHRNNKEPANNRWSNLREATPLQNMGNTKRPRNNTSGFKGVRWSKAANKWVARISIDNRQKHLGCFLTPEEAHEAYKKAAVERFGEFARFE